MERCLACEAEGVATNSGLSGRPNDRVSIEVHFNNQCVVGGPGTMARQAFCLAP